MISVVLQLKLTFIIAICITHNRIRLNCVEQQTFSKLVTLNAVVTLRKMLLLMGRSFVASQMFLFKYFLYQMYLLKMREIDINERQMKIFEIHLKCAVRLIVTTCKKSCLITIV